MRKRREKQVLQSVNYRIKPEFDAMLGEIAEQYGCSINTVVNGFFDFAITHRESSPTPTLGECIERQKPK